MTFIDFRNAFSDFLIIPKIEIEKQFPNYAANALTRWQKKGYIEKIRNGFYRLNDSIITGEKDLFYVANHLYFPSYVSLQSALSWYGFIPEGVFTITSVTTKNNRTFETPLGHFSYKNFKNKLFFGYNMVKTGNFYCNLATPEKAILDFLYLFPQYNTKEDMIELRWNTWEIRSNFDVELARKQLELFQSKALKNRFELFVKHILRTDENY